MKRVMDKLKTVALNNRKMLVFIFGLALMGIISGSIFTTMLSSGDKILVKEYITSFIQNIETGKLDYLDSFKNAFLSNAIFIITIWVLGISIIGIPLNIFIFFTKNFILGFSISSFILQYKTKGCLLSLLYIFPHHLINVIVYAVLLIFSIHFSRRILQIIKSKKQLTLSMAFKRYMVIGIGALIITFITSFMEVFATPFIIKKILFIIK